MVCAVAGGLQPSRDIGTICVPPYVFRRQVPLPDLLLEARVDLCDVKVANSIPGGLIDESTGLVLRMVSDPRASKTRSIRVPGAVDQHLPRYVDQTRLRAQPYAPLGQGSLEVGHHGVEEQVDACIQYCLVAQGSVNGRIHPDLMVRMPWRRLRKVRQTAAALGNTPGDQVPSDARDHLPPPGVEKAGKRDTGHRHRATQDPILLDQKRACAGPSGLHRGNHARSPPPITTTS